MSLMIDSAPFIQKIRLLSQQQGLTQAELAEKAGLSRSQLSRLLSGKNKRVQQATVDKIVAVFGLTRQEFLDQSDDASEIIPAKPSPKAIYSDRLPTVAGTFIGRRAELSLLDDALANPEINILQFIAPGGTGKTKLLRHWLNTRRNTLPAMIAWSFYSQGATADKQISTSPFFHHALQVLNAEQQTFESDEDKGDYLAGLLRDQQCVLVLDGLEPLQYADAANRGELKDRALVRLLKNLAGQSGAFCVITTRIAVYELSDRASVVSHNLQNLAIADGVALLQSLGVQGKEAALLKAVQDYAGHALALSLLGNLLRLRYRGDIDKLDTLPALLQEAADKTSRHAFKVMQAYQDWFAGTPELSLLYLLGLFDRPVEPEVFEALWQARITGLTDTIQEAEWFSAIDSLRHDHHILTDSSDSGQGGGASQVLDCHPLIREYFGAQLKQNNAEAWQAAHVCLYEYYKAVPDKELPDTLEEMRPLFYAVKHACEVGLHQQVFDEVYWPRISRQDERYLTLKLGAFSDDLAVLSHFFARQWDTVREGFSGDDKDLLISLVAYCLSALGRVKEAIQPSKHLLEILVAEENWAIAAPFSGHLGQQQVALGLLVDAVETTRLGISYADYSGEPFERVRARAAHASALHQTGKIDEALALFEEAEAIYHAETIEAPYLYSIWGYSDLLLECQQIESLLDKMRRAEQWVLEDRLIKPSRLTLALDALNVGRMRILRREFPEAIDSIERAFNGLHESGRKDLLPLALLTRAQLFRETGDFSKARQDLQEVHNIAFPSGMLLYLTDYHLEMARVLLKQWQQQLLDDTAQDDIQSHIAAAVKLIDETGYHRRDAAVEALIGPSQITPDKQQTWSEEW